jgi:capsular polysaccharide biosynthesis protein
MIDLSVLRDLRVPAALKRPLALTLGIALLVAATVVVAVEVAGKEYESRVGVLAVPTAGTPDQPPEASFGEVVALSLPALVELARTPTVLRATADELGTTTDELARRVSVELVPASGLARLSVRAETADRAAQAATRIAQTVVEADLFAPVARLRLLDRPETTRVAPDRPLAYGLALIAGLLAGLAAHAVGHLRRTRPRDLVRAALTAAGVRHPVAVLPDDDPRLTERLTLLCEASARPARVVAVVPDLTRRADDLAAELPDKTGEPADGDAVIAVVPDGGPQDELATVIGALPATATLVAVVTC